MKRSNINIPGFNVDSAMEVLDLCNTSCELAFAHGVLLGYITSGSDRRMLTRVVQTGMNQWKGMGDNVSK
jgi:hypothetical protein